MFLNLITSDYGSEGWGFKSLRVHHFEFAGPQEFMKLLRFFFCFDTIPFFTIMSRFVT